MTRQATDQLYIDLEYFTPEEYYVYVAEVSANTASAFNLSADVEVIEPSGEIVEATGAFTAEFTQVTAAGTVFDVSVAFDALFTPDFSVEVLINSVAVLDTTASLQATTSKFTGYESLQEFFAALNAQAARTRTTDTAQSAEFSVDIVAARTRDTLSSLAASFECTGELSQVNFVEASFDSEFTFSAEVKVTRDLEDTILEAESSLVLTVDKIRNASANLISQGFVVSTVGQLLDDVADLEAVSVLTVIGEKTATDTASLVVDSDLSAVVGKFETAAAAFAAELIQDTQFIRIRPGDVSLHSASTVQITVDVQRNSSADLSAQGFVVAVVGQRLDDLADLVVTSSLTASANKIQKADIALNSEFTVAADALKLKTASAVLATATSLTSTAQRIKQGAATLTSAASLTCDFNALTNYAPRWYGSFNLNFLFQVEPGSSGAQFGDPSVVVINGVSTLHPDYPFANLIPTSTQQGAPTRANKPFSIRLIDGQGDDVLIVNLGVIESSGTYFERDYQWNVTDNLSWRNQPGVWHRLELSVFQNTATLTINGASLGQPNIARTPSAFFNAGVVNVPSTSFIPWHNLVSAPFAGSGSTANITDVHFNSTSSKAKFAQAFFSATSSLSVDFLKVQFADSNLTAVSTLAADVDNIKGTSANLATTAQTTVTAVKTVSAAAETTTTATLNCVIGKVTGYASNQTAEFTQTTDNVRVRFADSEQSSEAELTADTLTSRTRRTAAALSADSELSADNVRTRDVVTELEAIATKLAAVAIIGDFLVTLESASELTAQVQVVTDTRNDLETVFTLDVTATKAVEAESDIRSEFSLDEVSTRIRFADTDLDAVSELSADGERIRFADTDFAAAFDTEIAPNRIRPAEAQLNTTATLETEFDVIKEAEADLTSEFEGVFSLQKIVRLELDLQVQAFTLTVGDVINIDPRTQLRVLRETRRIRIAQENNTVLVPKETRILVI